MTRRNVGVAALVGAMATFATAVAASMGGTSVEVVNGPPDSGDIPGLKSCGAWCDGVWIEAGQCSNNQECCGWVTCHNGNSQNTCCVSRPECRDGRHTDPPSIPKCVAVP